MSPADLSAALRRALAHEARDRSLARPSVELAALVGAAGSPALLAQLDATRPYSTERDALLGALLRQHQERRDGAALGALLYALHESVTRRGRRLTTAPYDADEARAQVVHALVESLDAFDLEHRSKNVQASLELDTLKKLRRALLATRRQRRAETTAVLVADAASDGLSSETYTLADLLEPADIEAREIDDDDRAAARVLLQMLVMEGLLRTWEALLVVRVDVLGHRIVDVGRDLGMVAATARKTLERARASLLGERARVEVDFPVTFVGRHGFTLLRPAMAAHAPRRCARARPATPPPAVDGSTAVRRRAARTRPRPHHTTPRRRKHTGEASWQTSSPSRTL